MTVEAAEDVVVAVVAVVVVAAVEAAVGFAVVVAAAAVPWVSSSLPVLLPTTAVSLSVQQCLTCWMRSQCWRCRHQSHRRSRSAKGLCHGPGIGKKTCQLSRKNSDFQKKNLVYCSPSCVSLGLMGACMTCRILSLCSCTVCPRCGRGCASFGRSNWQSDGHNHQTHT